MGESCKEPKFSLRLVVDEEKNKVVLAEACRDFVDVLFSILTLPMGTIVRLLEKHRKTEIGCFSNLYKSVVDMSIDDFETEACKQMLLFPRSVKEVQCKRLKLNINPNDDGKYFVCSSSLSCKVCSNFSTSRCRCGNLMNKVKKIQISADNKVVDNIENGVFVSGRCSFIITDDLKVSVMSTDLVLKKLKSIGSGGLSKVGERLVDIGFEEVMTLLQCIFSSNAPLTDTFLNKHTPQGLRKTCEMLSPCMERKRKESEAEPEEKITLSAIVRKHDMKVLYVESGGDFVDLLFTFLALPLEYVVDLSGDSSSFGYNLFNSFKDLSADTEVSTTKSMLPHYYKCQNQLLNIVTTKPRTLTIISTKEDVVLIDPKSLGIKPSAEGSWFVKRDTKFTVSDDLIITPMNSSSVFCLLKKFEIESEDLEVQEISISKREALNLLRASMVMTYSVLNTALSDLITKEKSTKKRPLCETQLRRSQRKKKT